MDNLEFDEYLNIVNAEKLKKWLDTYIPLYPMFRVEDEKLYIGVMMVGEHDNVWDKEKTMKPEYWVLIDINHNQILEWN